MIFNNFDDIGKKIIIKHRSPTQTVKSQPMGQRIMPEKPALSAYPWVGISQSASETDVRFYLPAFLDEVVFPKWSVVYKERICFPGGGVLLGIP